VFTRIEKHGKVSFASTDLKRMESDDLRDEGKNYLLCLEKKSEET